MKTLDELATEFVGDGGRPNMVFVTNASGNVIAVLALPLKRSIWIASQIDGAWRAEDRLTGEVWACPACEQMNSAED